MYWLDIICLPLQVYPLPISVPQETVWSEQTGSLMLQLPTGFSQRKAPAGGRNKKGVNKDWLHPSLIQSQEASPQSSPSTAAGDRFFSCPFRTDRFPCRPAPGYYNNSYDFSKFYPYFVNYLLKSPQITHLFPAWTRISQGPEFRKH